MKKWISVALIMLVFGMAISSCLKDDSTTLPDCSPLTTTAPANEVDSLKRFLSDSGIVATQDSRGFFYTLDNGASTDTSHPTRCSDVSVTYNGTFLSGESFDSTRTGAPTSLNLSITIAGWQEAIPLMKKDATMTLYVPPSLGYGSSDYYDIPGNSYLIFKIKLWGYN
jgi:FKBP-type peptidyl-prolyl cis-trans isomerase FkpA